MGKVRSGVNIYFIGHNSCVCVSGGVCAGVGDLALIYLALLCMMKRLIVGSDSYPLTKATLFEVLSLLDGHSVRFFYFANVFYTQI